MILATIALAAAGAKAAGGIMGGYKSKKAAREAYRKQRALSRTEYKFNKEELEKTFKSNLEINFSNTASDLFDITQNHLSKFSSINILTAKFAGTGLAMSSSIKDVKNVMSDEYLTKLEDTKFLRNYREGSLSAGFTNNLYQLQLNRSKTELGLSTAYTSAKQAANQKMFNSAVGGAMDIFSIQQGQGGFGNIFGGK